MTPKERLERIKTVIKNGGVYRDYTDSIKPFMEDIKAVEEALGVSYPTSEEVCKALIDFFKKSKYHGYIDTAHEKLIEMGYETIKGNNCVFYRHDELPKITIYSDNTYSCNDTNLELSRILTQYLEEMK